MSIGRALFGTDGVRGVANRGLTPEVALRLGRAVAGRLEPGGGTANRPRPRVLIGRDPRHSGPMLEAALAAGLASAGADVLLAGVVPTPAVAELVPLEGLAAGAVISASHNPFPDNGIKLFGPNGFKLPDAQELAIEAAMEQPGERPEGAGLGTITPWPEGRERYLDALLARHPLDLTGFRVMLDCAHGATVTTAPQALRRLGAAVTVIGGEPNGLNINEGCGSTDLAALAGAVGEGDFDLGLAFDGDGDRVLAVTAEGEPVDGDQILALLALHAHARGELAGGAVVTTTMTNLGFRRAMASAGIEVRWTDVGDRYVLEELLRGGYVLGGEQSGHLIHLAHGPTGDGLASALALLDALVARGEPLSAAARVMSRLPQALVSVPVADRGALAGADGVWAAVRAFEAEMGEDGRVVVRASGTEPLVRVMVEAPSGEDCERWCDRIVAAVEAELGTAPVAG